MMKIYFNNLNTQRYSKASSNQKPQNPTIQLRHTSPEFAQNNMSMPFYRPIYFTSSSLSENKEKYINMSQEQRGNFFDDSYYNNGQKTNKSNYVNYARTPEFTKSRREALIKKLNLNRNQKILDYGCAKGYMVEDFCEIGYDFYGYDISKYAVSQAAPHIKPRLTNDFKELSNFDYIISKDVFEHVPYEEIDNLLGQLNKIGKKMFVVLPLAKDGEYILEGDRADASHVIKESCEWWQKTFKKAGFVIDEVSHEVEGFLEHRTKDGRNGVGFFTLHSTENSVKSAAAAIQKCVK